MPFYAPNVPNLPFGLSDQPMQEMNPQPWENPGDDPQMQDQLDLDQPYTEQWGLYSQGEDPAPVFDIDTVIDFKFKDTAKVSDFPVETGAFASYNKVVHPFKPKLKMAVSGQDRIAALLGALASAVRSTNIYDVYTPEVIYTSVTVEDYDYARTATKGRSMLVVEVTLMQVIQVSASYTTVKLPTPKTPAAADSKNNGKQQPVQPSNPLPIEQENAAMAGKLGLNPSSLGVHA